MWCTKVYDLETIINLAYVGVKLLKVFIKFSVQMLVS
jgi:hypothetical protein